MKLLFPLMIFAAISTSAHAHPGSHTLICKSAKNSGSTQKVELSLKRSNGSGWFAPEIGVNIAGKSFQLTTPDEVDTYGNTFHNSPLKVIMATVNVPRTPGTIGGYMSIVAIPESVKAFDQDNKPVKWNLDAEKDECNDSNGSAKFQSIIHGAVEVNSELLNIDTQILDCTLEYNSGMAC